MIEENTLSAIRAAEKKAVELKELAEKERDKLIGTAQKKAMEIIAAREKETERKSAVALKKFYDDLKKRKEAVLSKGMEESGKLKKTGEKKLPDAVDFLFREFRKETEK